MHTRRANLGVVATLAAGIVASSVALCAPASSSPVSTSASASASATHDDSFSFYTTNYCGWVKYVDYGPGLSGSGNDDYVLVRDTCATGSGTPDGHGVKAWAWLTRGGVKHYLGDAYDPYGAKGTVVWDPFLKYGNVKAGDYVGLKVCLVDGNDDSTPTHCQSFTSRSVDG